MSHENVEIARRGMEAGSQFPKPDFATVNSLYHPAHEFVDVTLAVRGDNVGVGVAGFRAWLGEMSEAWVHRDQTVEHAESVDEDRVLLVMRFKAESKTGARVDQRLGFIMTLQDGKIMRTESYSSVQEARKAAGLSEQDVQANPS
jgi:ketosteroid isomerase-like protein